MAEFKPTRHEYWNEGFRVIVEQEPDGKWCARVNWFTPGGIRGDSESAAAQAVVEYLRENQKTVTDAVVALAQHYGIK